MRNRGGALVWVGIGFLAACGGGSDSVFQASEVDSGPTSSSSSGGGSSGSVIPVSDSGSDASNCPSQTLCGSLGACCAIGEECVEGACKSACASGVRCAATCCGTGQVCLSAACVNPGTLCADSFDCEETEFCEPTLGKCLPQPSGALACEFRAPPGPLAPKLEWSWTDSTIFPGYNQVINMPVVIDLTGDKIPEVIIVTSKLSNGTDSDFSSSDPAFLRVLSGRDGTELWAATVDAYKDGTSGNPDYRVNPRGTPAAADLDGNGTIEIVVPRRAGGLLAFRADGSFLWASTRADGITAYNGGFESSTVSIADMNSDGLAEIAIGGVIFNHQGKLVTDTSIGRELWGANQASYGPVSIIADVDGNVATTDQFLVTGNRAIRRDGTLLWDVSGTLTDGYPAIADLNNDGVPELVVVGQGAIRVQNATSGALIAQLTMPGTGRGGPPTIADFDNDGKMEIASANGTKYSVFEYDPNATPKLSAKWSADTQDGSSNVTGSSVFDFDGDGSAEVVYNDECYARVYRGSDGMELFKVANSSATIHEYPVLVDVDGDNNTEFVIAANDRNHLYGGTSCAYPVGTTPRHGVFSYGDTNDKWVRTRRVWNQHAYHLTNIQSDGKLPAPESRSWEPTENNNYRVSSQGKGSFNAPDLKVDFEVSTRPCPTGLELRARVKNEGSLGVPAGAEVKFYRGSNATGPLIATKLMTKALLPGESEVLTQVVSGVDIVETYFVTVNSGGGTASVLKECKEDNNSATGSGVRCPSVK